MVTVMCLTSITRLFLWYLGFICDTSLKSTIRQRGRESFKYSVSGYGELHFLNAPGTPENEDRCR